MGRTVYLPIFCMVDVYGKLVGKYTSPMDCMGQITPNIFSFLEHE